MTKGYLFLRHSISLVKLIKIKTKIKYGFIYNVIINKITNQINKIKHKHDKILIEDKF